MLRIARYAFLCSLLMLSCRQEAQFQDVAIRSMMKRFPPLLTHKQHWAQEYTLLKRVSFGFPKITIDLFTQPDSFEDPQQFLLLTNGAGRAATVPLLSNTHRDYWKFPGENPPKGIKPVTSTFEAELNRCLNNLELNDTLGTAANVLDELFFSVLNCRQVELSDSSRMQSCYLIENDLVPTENLDSCHKRMAQNWKLISREMHVPTLKPHLLSYWDGQRCRIYQLVLENYEYRQQNFFGFVAYRQDCNQIFLQCGNR